MREQDMSEAGAVIRVENVSKRFVLRSGKPADLRERFARIRRGAVASPQEFWALRDVSFSVQPGQTVGIIGHNGSGKSTLLKMLTGILKPTSGRIQVRGRVGALIEVGAGFHPDLSGRENIFLNGSILGLSRRDIERKFDEIVAFAGLESFIDTPVKRYSSGMYMRLGFAVAAHTEPDILLIDEVLAVGDALFQRKCLRHLERFVAKGGAVVFVSHALNQVTEICDSCVWLDHGEVRFIGPTVDAIDHYMAVVTEREDAEFKRLYPQEWEQREAERTRAEEAERRRQEEAEEALRLALTEAQRECEEAERQKAARLSDPKRGRLTGVTLRDGAARARTEFQAGEPLRVEIGYRFGRSLPCPTFCFEIFRRADGLHMFTTSNFDHEMRLTGLSREGNVAFDIPFLSLNEGVYTVRLRLYSDWSTNDWDSALEDEMLEAATLTVTSGRFAHGCAYLPVHWVAHGAVMGGEGPILTAAQEGRP
jgi:lipopolysaccharide transport system ATP-binding protein